MTLTIYCCGGVRKSTDPNQKLHWGPREQDELARAAAPRAIRFVHPESPVADLSDSAALFGRDLYGVKMADAVVVDARERRGIGIGIEMLAAKLFGKPMIAVVPRNSHYHRDRLAFRGGSVDDYVHPHLLQLCDAIVRDFTEAGRWVAECAASTTPIKGEEALELAIAAYESHLLASDEGMHEALGGCPPSVSAKAS